MTHNHNSQSHDPAAAAPEYWLHKAAPLAAHLMGMDMETRLVGEKLLQVLHAKDAATGEHSNQHSQLGLLLAEELALPRWERHALWLSGVLHDIGKLAVPDAILQKSDALTPEEYLLIRQHAVIGETLVRELFQVEDVAVAVGSHHEYFDGQGYPRGLTGEDIPRLGRMLAVVDAYSA